MSKKTSALTGRIKKLMQEDEDVGRVSQGAPAAVAHAMEVLIERLVKGAHSIAADRADKCLGPAHLKQFVLKEPSMDFLSSIVANAPELPEKKEPGAKRERKPRAPKAEDDGESPASPKKRGRGRGRGRAAGEGGGRGRGRKKKGAAEAENEEQPPEKKPKLEGDAQGDDLKAELEEGQDTEAHGGQALKTEGGDTKDLPLEEGETEGLDQDVDQNVSAAQAQAVSALFGREADAADAEDDDYD